MNKSPFLNGNKHLKAVPPQASGMRSNKELREQKAKADLDEALERSELKFESKMKAMQIFFSIMEI